MMKQNRPSLLLLCLVWLMTFSCTKRIEYDHVLDRAEQQNKSYDSIIHIDSIKLAVRYFDNYGTPNERVRAHYLLGCAYRDAGEAPMALECYHDAAECADTTKTDCDYRQLMVIHSQMADLFYKHLLPYEMKDELDEQFHYALLNHDTLSAINALEHKSDFYSLLNNLDSVIDIRERSYSLYKKYGFDKEAARSLGPLIIVLIEEGNSEKARQYLDIYESEGDLIREGEVEKRKVIYYYYKGQYNLAINKTDSAEILFRKLLKPDLETNQIEAGYRGLYLLYKQIGEKDSLAKYADLCYQLNDSIYAQTAKESMQQMHSLYNYSRSQKVAQEMSDKAHQNQITLYLVTFLTILLLIIIGVAWWNSQRKKQEELRQLQIQYENEKTNLKKAKKDLERMESRLNETDISHLELLEQKNSDILGYEQKVRELEAKLKIERKKVSNQELMDTPIYQHFRNTLLHPKEKLSKKDWSDLRDMIAEKIPTFYTELNCSNGKLTQSDYDVCILVRLYFKPGEIATLTDNSASVIAMKRSRLLKKVFGIEGAPEQFDKLIQQIY